MIAVVGQPAYRPASDTVPGGSPGAAAGPAVDVARAAVGAGASAQIIGKVGADHTGDVLLLDLARVGIGHAAVLRDPGRPTPAAPSQTDAETREDPDEGLILDPRLEEHDEVPQARAEPVDSRARLTLDPGDVELGLRYLTGYRVIVAAEPLGEATLAVIAEAAAYAGAHLVVVTAPGSARPILDPSIPVTLLEAPPDDPDEQFASLVGRYAAALDAGVAADEAFRAALSPSGWEPVPPAT
jgi:hypothetical protein